MSGEASLRYRSLTHAQRCDYLDTLRGSHYTRCNVEVRDTDDRLVRRYDEHELPIIDGQVDVDESQPVARQLHLTLANTSETTTDPTNPRSALTSARQLHVLYGVFVDFSDGSSRWVDVPVFYGPVTRISRDAETVQVEGQSKEAYLLPPSRLVRSAVPNEDERDNKVQSYYAGHLIRSIARRHGETRLRVPRTNRRLPDDAKLFDRAKQEDGAWPLLQSVAGAQQLYYSADGFLTLRTRRSRSPVYVFSDGADGEVLSAPTVEWDLTQFRNTVELRAFQKKQGNEKQNPTLRVVARLEPGHPLSARSLARNGQPRELLQTVETQDVYASLRAAQADADRMLARLAHNAQDVTFDSLPIPHLEPGDVVALDLDGKPRIRFTARKFSVPLGPAAMSIGYTRRISR